MLAGAMIVHRSNRIEALVDALAELVAVPLADPFAPEWIAVQGRGMERWLAIELARRLGVWANPAFPFPRRVIDAAAAAVLGDTAPLPAVFEPGTLRWAIAEVLPQQLGRPGFGVIRRYLEDDPRGVKRLQLAGRIADLFDQYAVYRPHMVLEWERGAGGDWQGALWRELVRTHGATHAAARAQALLAALAAGRAPAASFPRRLSLFGISTLPPLYVQILAAIANTVELHLFLLSPSREYWGEIRSRRERIREMARAAVASPTAAVESPERQPPLPGFPEAEPAQPALADTDGSPDLANPEETSDEGHPLLASLGRVGRDFQYVLEGCADYQDDPRERYIEPGQGSMLAVLQSDILALRMPDATAASEQSAAQSRVEVAADDNSIAVHACHGAMREVEVLHDQLLALFAQHETLTPPDVVVMTPSIETYAPLVEAVFGSGGRPSIPFCIADRRPRAQHEVLDAFLRALELLRGRLPAPAVLDLLTLEPVRARFGIAVEEIDRLRCWVAEAGIRWGADGVHRGEVGQPPCDDNTWRFGLDRLLLGYALPGQDALLFGDVLPYDDVEGSDAALLGRFAELCATMTRFRSAVRDAQSPSAWRQTLGALLAALLANTPSTAYQHHAIMAGLEALAEQAAAGAFTGSVDLGAMRPLLEAEIERAGSARGFLTGSVTFCEMVPMRTIPFRVVCLLGLNDGAFPRARRPLGFDRMAEHPQAGDRTARDDDRYLFLEALLAAREHLMVTYVGQSISDNSDLPPSVVVSELLDAIDRTFVSHPDPDAPDAADRARARDEIGGRADAPTTRARDRVVQRHALQAFSPHYFGRDPQRRAFSYAATHYAGARALVGPRRCRPPVLAAPLPADPVETVGLDELVRFFDNPSRWFLQRKLGVYLGRDAELLDDREPIALDALDSWFVGDALLRRVLRGGDPAEAWGVWRAGGTLPLGTPGRCAFDAIAPRAAALGAISAGLRGGDRLPAETIDLTIDGIRLTAVLRELWPGGQLAAQYSKLGRRHELGLWIRHLARHAARATAAPSVLVGRCADGAGAVWFSPPPEPLRLLEDLLRLFRFGQVAPMPFFGKASRAFAQALAKASGTPDRAWSDALKAFGPTSYGPPVADADDPYVAELYPKGLPVDASTAGVPSQISFADAAQAVFTPFFAHHELRT
jgi:exodeoxyribonuclease V gamma subunit